MQIRCVRNQLHCQESPPREGGREGEASTQCHVSLLGIMISTLSFWGLKWRPTPNSEEGDYTLGSGPAVRLTRPYPAQSNWGENKERLVQRPSHFPTRSTSLIAGWFSTLDRFRKLNDWGSGGRGKGKGKGRSQAIQLAALMKSLNFLHNRLSSNCWEEEGITHDFNSTFIKMRNRTLGRLIKAWRCWLRGNDSGN